MPPLGEGDSLGAATLHRIDKSLPRETCGMVCSKSFRVIKMFHTVLLEGNLRMMCLTTDPGNTRLYIIDAASRDKKI